MTTIDLTPRLRLAADYLTEHGWLKGEMGESGGPACLTGAIRFCAPLTGDEHIIRGVLAKRDRAENWNDASGIGQDAVVGFLRTAEITDADLADTYGRQWVEVVALVRAAATLTPDQARDLAAAWDAAGDAARYAAGYAARAAAGDAARAAAGYAAGYAARAAAGDAARAAAGYAAGDAAGDAAGYALSIRHLIGEHGFTQAHYDTLTGPWRRTIGKLHADDADLA